MNTEYYAGLRRTQWFHLLLLLQKLDTIVISVNRRLLAVIHHHENSSQNKCMSVYNSSEGSLCRAKPRTVLNDLALSDAHSWQTENHICDALSKPVLPKADWCRTHLMPVG